MNNSDDISNSILSAIHKLEISVVQRLAEHADTVRQRFEDVERRHMVELKEFQIKVWERFEQISNKIHEKTDGQRANSSAQTVMTLLGFLGTIAVTAIAVLYRKIGG